MAIAFPFSDRLNAYDARLEQCTLLSEGVSTLILLCLLNVRMPLLSDQQFLPLYQDTINAKQYHITFSQKKKSQVRDALSSFLSISRLFQKSLTKTVSDK
jgi:hypothetical protein